MSNDILKDFILSHAKEINNNDFKSVYSKALDEYVPTSVTPRFTKILLDAGINPLLHMDYVPTCYAYKLNWTSVVIPNTVKSIGDSAFYGCTGLKNITIPDSVTSIGYGAFSSCTGLTNITLPDSLTHINFRTFGDCTALEGIKIPDSVTSIGEGAFYNCSGLTSIIIPDSVTHIGEYAFSGCRGLTNITIPDSVTSIGEYAFRNCSKLQDIIFKGTIKQWEAIPKGSAWDYNTNGYTIHCIDGELKA